MIEAKETFPLSLFCLFLLLFPLAPFLPLPLSFFSPLFSLFFFCYFSLFAFSLFIFHPNFAPFSFSRSLFFPFLSHSYFSLFLCYCSPLSLSICFLCSLFPSLFSFLHFSFSLLALFSLLFLLSISFSLSFHSHSLSLFLSHSSSFHTLLFLSLFTPFLSLKPVLKVSGILTVKSEIKRAVSDPKEPTLLGEPIQKSCKPHQQCPRFAQGAEYSIKSSKR